MPLPAPKLDDRSFQDLVDEAKRRIPRYTPEWTDHNVSDPGVTMIELFAYMVDMLLYRVNRVPDRNYIKWLDLLGIKLAPPRPARVDLTFYLAAPQPEAVTVPLGTEVATVRTENQEAITFSTERDLTINVPHLTHSLVNRAQAAYHDYLLAVRNPALNVGIFQDPPQPNDAIYFGYEEDMASHLLLLSLGTTVEGVGVDPNDPPRAWEYWNPALGTRGGWDDLVIDRDTTGGFNKSGEVLLHIPHGAGRRVLNDREAFWIRARVTPPRPDQQPYAGSPRIISIDSAAIGGTVVASQVERIAGEVIGRSSGKAGQEWSVQYPPVAERRPDEYLEVEGDGGEFLPWTEVEDFGASTSDDPHYTLDSVSGAIRFGPTLRNSAGRELQFGRVAPPGRLMRFNRYRTGGGLAGNVGAGTITVLKSSIPYISAVTNRLGAVGGEDAETLELAKMRAPRVLRNRSRAVTATDFESLTREASPEISRCRCIPPSNEDIAIGDPIVRVLVVPLLEKTDGPISRQDLRLSDRVRTEIMAYLNERKLLTANVEVHSPDYTWVSVEVSAVARRRTNRDELRAAVERRLYSYINPVYGGPAGDGRAFDEPLYLSEIFAIVQSVEGIEHVESVQLFSVDHSTGLRSKVEGSVATPPGGLLASDTHVVTIR